MGETCQKNIYVFLVNFYVAASSGFANTATSFVLIPWSGFGAEKPKFARSIEFLYPVEHLPYLDNKTRDCWIVV